jgi:hypothetical protein
VGGVSAIEEGRGGGIQFLEAQAIKVSKYADEWRRRYTCIYGDMKPSKCVGVIHFDAPFLRRMQKCNGLSQEERQIKRMSQHHTKDVSLQLNTIDHHTGYQVNHLLLSVGAASAILSI